MEANKIYQFQSTLFQLVLAIFVGALVGMTIAYATPAITIFALLSIVMVFLVIRRPEIGVLGVIILTATLFDWSANIGISIGIGHIYLTDIILLALLSVIAVKALMQPGFMIVRTPLDIVLLLFVGVAFLSTAISIFKGTMTLQDVLGKARDIANYMFFFVVTNLIRKDKQINLLSKGMIALAAAVSLVMIAQYLLGTTIPVLPGRVEVLITEGATYSSVTRIIPPGYSLVFVGFIVLSTMMFFRSSGLRNSMQRLAFVLTAIGVLLTFKRHFWAASILLLMVMVYLSRRKEMNRMIVGGVVTLALVSIGTYILLNYTGEIGPNLIAGSFGRLTSLANPRTYSDPNSSLRWRDFEYQYAAPQIIAHPIFGMGLDAHYRPFVPGRDYAGYDLTNFIHNGFLAVLVFSGVLGLIAILWLLALFFSRGFKYWRQIPKPTHQVYVLGFTLAMLGMLIGTWVEPMIIESRWTVLIAVMLGINEVLISSIPKESLAK